MDMEHDPLGNPISISLAPLDCPYEGCHMTFPHKHSLIFCKCRFLVAMARTCPATVCPYRSDR